MSDFKERFKVLIFTKEGVAMGNRWVGTRLVKNIFLGCLFLLFLASSTPGEEKRILIPSYEGEELAKVRNWEKTWAGKKVDKTNVDQVKDFLLEHQVKVLKDPQYMNAKEYWFEIVPYKQSQHSKGQVEMTKKNAPVARLDGDVLVDYTNMAGFIFPEPKSGVEVAYNFDMQTKGDSRSEVTDGYVVEPRTGIARQSGRMRIEMYWSGRTYSQPYPNLPDNKKNFRRTLFSRHLSPADFKDMTVLEVKYNDMHVEDDEWIWMPNFRRIRRQTHAQRGDNIDGTELIYDDDGGWYDHVARNTYKLLGRKELLLVRHLDRSKMKWVPGSGVYNGVNRERIKTYEVEAVYKQPHYTYSKQIWYVDPEQWLILIKVCWDEDGKLWRMNENFYGTQKTVGGEEAYVPGGTMSWDILGRHASVNAVPETKNIGKNFSTSQFSLNAMQKQAY